MDSVSSTPRSNNFTPIFSRTPRKLISCRRSLAPPDTPENSKRGASKEKINEIGNLLTVAVRVRPMNNRELSCSSIYDTIAVNQDKNELTVRGLGLSLTHSFQYDHIFYSTNPDNCHYANQKDVFLTLGKPMLDSAFKGYNACLFAYGQTGSGKSYSMMGENCNVDENSANSDLQAGIIPRFCYDLFNRISQLSNTSCATVEISYFEIYNEKIYDLLAVPVPALDRRTPLKVREHPAWGPYVVNLTPHTVKSFTEIKDLLYLGNKYRATAATVINEKSSRSHSIVSIELSVCEIDNNGGDSGRRSKISLVDLAGSERVGNNSSNDDRHREGVSINQSLLTLGKVISSLADCKKGNNFIPYRESILTWLLRESLGGNSLTSMLATITPASTHVDETLATLRYACQARSIVNRAIVNENPHDRLIRELRAEVERLRALRQGYERSSLTPVNNLSIGNNSNNDSSVQELEDLRQKLSETERNLEDAQNAWEQRFLETKAKQLQELAEAEQQKLELESHMRVMNGLDKEIKLSPYRSNFLEELEDVLDIDLSRENNKENYGDNINDLIYEANKWCEAHDLQIIFSLVKQNQTSLKNILVKHKTTNKIAYCNINHLKKRFDDKNCPEKFISSLNWIQHQPAVSTASKTIISKNWQLIKNSINILKPFLNQDDELQKAFGELETSLNSFETVLNNSKYCMKTKSVKNKSVKFYT